MVILGGRVFLISEVPLYSDYRGTSLISIPQPDVRSGAGREGVEAPHPERGALQRRAPSQEWRPFAEMWRLLPSLGKAIEKWS